MYYLGVSGNQNPQQQQPQQQSPYMQLGQQSFNIGGAAPTAQSYMGNNTLFQQGSALGKAPKMGSMSSNMAQSLDQVPTEVLQAQERYRPGNAGLGDQTSSLFDRSLLGQYNQMEAAYEKQGEDFVPWALRGAGAGGGGFNPNEVDLFGANILGKNNSYQYDAASNYIQEGRDNYNPITGQMGSFQMGNAQYAALPTFNYNNWSGDIFGAGNNTALATRNLNPLFNQYQAMGVRNLPGMEAYQQAQVSQMLNRHGGSNDPNYQLRAQGYGPDAGGYIKWLNEQTGQG